MSIASVWNVILIVLGFGMLIGLHELGHFVAAKWSSIRTNAFAIGMGPVVLAWRGGIGLTLGSTKKKTIDRHGKDASEMSDAELETYGLSETEYSLRLLPIGGFVSMLGQEDDKPAAISEDPRSYNKCPIGKRMIVVSAGVVMNLLLAAVLFIGCFQAGVRFEAPVIGQIIPNSPAAESVAHDGSRLQPGDTVVLINGKQATTFTDIQIASAMARPDSPVVMEVERAGIKGSLAFTMTPRSVTQSGLLELGLFPASSLRIPTGKTGQEVVEYLYGSDPTLDEIAPGLVMTSVNGERVGSWAAFEDVLQHIDGSVLLTTWEGSADSIEIAIQPTPSFEQFQPTSTQSQHAPMLEHGLLGLCPLAKIKSVLESSGNKGIIQAGDIVLSVESAEYPRHGQLREILSVHEGDTVHLRVLRNGKPLKVVAILSSGKLGVLLDHAWELPVIAQPLQSRSIDGIDVPTTVSGKQLLSGSRIAAVNGSAVDNWYDFRKTIVASDGQIQLDMELPIVSKTNSIVQLELTEEALLDISSLGWTTPLVPALFEPIYVIRSSGGNPFVAIKMGFDETINMVVMTYLTIDRLLRRTVGIEQLRGPVGIVHIGSRIADRGMSYLLFFLAIISVNLAVLNFLPLPIVDGGLFLYLVYEKFRGRPPSIAFQNASAMLGLGLIGILFVVTFYNDIVRLVG